jgi:hypothetical protein
LFNASGTTSCATPLGASFLSNSTGTLVPRASVSLALQFANPGKVTISYTPRVLAGAATR